MQIVDLYHVRQDLWELVRRLHLNDEGKQKAWMKVHPRRLLNKPTTFRETQHACAIPGFAASTYLSARV